VNFAFAALVAACSALQAQPASEPSPQRQQHLVRMVRQDCGSCHGLLLTGGLGPPLTAAALREFPLESLVATILNGRPGTPMPPWRAFVTEGEAAWIARNLRAGFPQEPEQRK
jgi:cytochrome c55X